MHTMHWKWNFFKASLYIESGLGGDCFCCLGELHCMHGIYCLFSLAQRARDISFSIDYYTFFVLVIVFVVPFVWIWYVRWFNASIFITFIAFFPFRSFLVGVFVQCAWNDTDSNRRIIFRSNQTHLSGHTVALIHTYPHSPTHSHNARNLDVNDIGVVFADVRHQFDNGSMPII